MKKKPPHTIQKKDANADPQISKDELPDSELNKVTGGRESSTPRQIFALIGLRRTLATAFRARPKALDQAVRRLRPHAKWVAASFSFDSSY
jgi:hypothetical protein